MKLRKSKKGHPSIKKQNDIKMEEMEKRMHGEIERKKYLQEHLT